MRISVIIPAFNAAATLGEALASVRAQTIAPHEILVVDDGSVDDTAVLAKSFGVKVIMQANAGVAAARNTGVKAASGDIIAFLDADDVWHPSKLELQTPLLNSVPFTATACYSWPGTIPTLQTATPTAISFSKLVVRNSLITSTVMLRKDIFQPFDTRLQGPEDYDLWLRLLQAHPGWHLPMPLTGYRSVAGSLSKNAVRMDEGMKLILQKLDAAEAFRRQPLLRRKAHGFYHYSCAYMYLTDGQRRDARRHIMKSLLQYPWYGRDDVRYLLGRLRLLSKTV